MISCATSLPPIFQQTSRDMTTREMFKASCMEPSFVSFFSLFFSFNEVYVVVVGEEVGVYDAMSVALGAEEVV